MEWVFKENAQPQGSSDGFWYDITWGGYIKPEEVLAHQEQIELLKNAVDLLLSFEEAMGEANLIIEF